MCLCSCNQSIWIHSSDKQDRKTQSPYILKAYKPHEFDIHKAILTRPVRPLSVACMFLSCTILSDSNIGVKQEVNAIQLSVMQCEWLIVKMAGRDVVDRQTWINQSIKLISLNIVLQKLEISSKWERLHTVIVICSVAVSLIYLAKESNGYAMKRCFIWGWWK